MGHFFFQGAAPVEHAWQHAIMKMDVPGGHDVIKGTEAGIQGNILKGSGQAEGSDFVRGGGRNFLSFKGNGARVGPVEAGHTIEYGSFAGPVGSDNSQDFALVYVKADIVQGNCAAKAQGHMLDRHLGYIAHAIHH
jgi:hypothetical protein